MYQVPKPALDLVRLGIRPRAGSKAKSFVIFSKHNAYKKFLGW